jgi:hydrogenase maturation protein HypF
MQLEFAAGTDAGEPYPVAWRRAGPLEEFDWGPMITAVLADLAAGAPTGRIAARFHATLLEVIVAFARRAKEPQVVLTGGCFQNARLAELAARALQEAGFTPYWPQLVPPDDGGLALGQAVAAARPAHQAKAGTGAAAR